MALTDTTIPPITGINDPAQARVLLYQAGSPVHAPLDNVGLLPLSGGAITGDLTIGGNLTIDSGLTIGGDIARASLWETISNTTVASPVASVVFTDLSAYLQLRLTGILYVVTTTAQPLLQFSIDNGSSYMVGTSEYWSLYEVVTGAGWASATLDMGYFPLIAVSGMFNTYPICFDLQIEGWNIASTNASMQARTSWVDAGSLTSHSMTSGGHTTIGLRNAFRLLCSSGNFNAGFCHLEGVRG